MRTYYKIGTSNANCPNCIETVVILMDVNTYGLFDHCGICRRSWNHVKPLSDAHQKKFDKLVAKIELAKVNPAGLKDPFAVIRKNDNKSKRHREQGGRA